MSELFRTIEPWAEAWGSNLWRASWQGGLVIVAAWAITRWCKFLSPRFACWIWRLACIKLLVGLIWVQPVAIPILTAGSPRILTAGNERRELAPTQTEIAAIRVNPEVGSVTANGKPRVSPAAHGNWNWLLALWLVGVGFRVSLTVKQWKSVQRFCRSAELAKSAALQDVCRHVADRLGIRQLPRIRFSPHTNVPLLAGVWRPMILLPAGALEAFDNCELRLMLGHEMAHLKRRDLMWNWLPTVVSWLFFFHPLIWFLPRRWSEALEAACDELLIQSDSAGAAACGRLLVKLAGREPGEQRAQLMAAGALGTYRDLKRRILAMARVKPISQRSLIVAAGTASLVALLGIIPWQLVAKEGQAAGRKRPATPTARLLAKLEEQNASPECFTDSWLRTLKEIVDLGSAAVPELTEELDATDNGMMMRCLGFSLRAIGDKRAVPALIRAIPKTLIGPGSDMGLGSQDAELAKFAQQHDLNEKHEGKEYDFGRPVREIFGALQKLTGQHMNEEELFQAFLQGTAAQKRMKRDLFYRTAKKWADWWEHNASDFVKDPAYSRVNLAKTPVDAVEPAQTETHYKTVGGGISGWVLESIFDPKPRFSFYDLDTGRAAELPEKWRDPKTVESHLDEILAWAANEGFDLMGVEYVAPDGERTYALRSIGLRAWELGRERWKMGSDDIMLETLQKEGTPVEGLLLHRDKDTKVIDPKAIATFFCITREGTPGLLFVGIEVKDDSLKPGGFSRGDHELDPIAFQKGRRFGYREFEEVK